MNHDHSHEHDTSNPIPFEEKLIRLLEHWIRHNEDHVKNHREWAGLAREHRLSEAASWIEEAAAMTEAVAGKFEKALYTLNRLGKPSRTNFPSS